ncbi:COX15/CtaA family protein, partial [Vibrio sp. M260118]|uniref:COX15/CtaA family protein n=1 Tax=Vibrio sp. M260118 TaxID=3020896 RepID=UPI002F41A18C
MKLINLVRFSLILTFIVIMLGAYTRLADAGLGCPDWPGCYGQLSVPNEQHEIALAQSLYPSFTVEADKAWLEMIHRYFAGTLGLVVFAITFIGVKTGRIPITMAAAIS